MRYIDPHIHCVSRTTDDYLYMARCGVRGGLRAGVLGGVRPLDRVAASRDYFRQLTDVEPKRAAQYGIEHYCWLCINAKEAENVALSREVIKLIPQLLDHPRVLGIGEIGLNKNTRNEITVFEEHVDLAAKHDQLILIHTPHLEDKHKGTRDHHRHPEERPADQARARADRPLRGAHDPHRARQRLLGRADALPGHQVHPAARRRHPRDSSAREMICVNSASDWGESSPSMLTDTCLEFRRRGHSEQRPPRSSTTTRAGSSASARSGRLILCPRAHAANQVGTGRSERQRATRQGSFMAAPLVTYNCSEMNILIISCSLRPAAASRLLAAEAARLLKSLDAHVEFIDLLHHKTLPFCDGEDVDDCVIEPLAEPIRKADAILIAVPIYNFDVNAAAKNVVELTGMPGRARSSASLRRRRAKQLHVGDGPGQQPDARLPLPDRAAFVYATDDFTGEEISSAKVKERMTGLCRETVRLARALNH